MTAAPAAASSWEFVQDILCPIRDLEELPNRITTCTAHPWTDPDFAGPRNESGVLPDAGKGYLIDDTALLFHTTSAENADAILRDGFKPSQPLEVGGHPWAGVPGRTMPAGIWASIRPTLPTDHDTWMPDVSETDWVILRVKVPEAVLADRYVFEHTWTVVQFCLQQSDIQAVDVLHPGELSNYVPRRLVELVADVTEEEDYRRPNPYLRALRFHAEHAEELAAVREEV